MCFKMSPQIASLIFSTCHIGCICLSFLHCVLSNVSSNRLPEQMQSHIGCTCLAFLHCVLSNVSSSCLPERMQIHTDCICLTFLEYCFLKCLFQHTCLKFPHCLFLFPLDLFLAHCFVAQDVDPSQASEMYRLLHKSCS